MNVFILEEPQKMGSEAVVNRWTFCFRRNADRQLHKKIVLLINNT